MRRRPISLALSGALALALSLSVTSTNGSAAGSEQEEQAAPGPPKNPTAVGRGGAVTSVDPNASRVGLRVLKNGGNAVDAAVATAAALGVAEPYSAGVGGGGYFVYYDARSRRVHTIDGRETAPRAMPDDAFIDPETGQPYAPFTPNLVTSGVSVGVPGTPATWTTALEKWGTKQLRKVIEPAARLAERGFVVDETFREQTEANEERFAAFTSSRSLFLRGGLPEVGTRFKNPALARTYRAFAKDPQLFYRGRLPGEIVDAVRHPPVTADTTLPVPPGFMKRRDLRDYSVRNQRPTSIDYRGYRVYGMAPSSSGGSTVGEALNILENYDLAGMDDAAALHHYLEASALAFADRGAYVGDPAYVDVPLRDLLSQKYADERACEIDPEQAATPKPIAAGDVETYDGECDPPADEGVSEPDTEGLSTTHLTATDRWGNVVAYTLTIEQTGGSGIVVPRRGFLLNNELTDFTAVPNDADPNRIQPGKRPRSSMSPTIVLRDGKPFLALGSPGGSTIITTVLQILFNRIDRGMPIPDAIAAPRASQRNTASVTSEPPFIDLYEDLLAPYGHVLVPSGDEFTPQAEIGAATGIEFGPRGLLTAVSEPVRRGGGSALVVRPK
jgi:gamma-glutamyltranspeptidase/glutathione hydrolase